MRIILIGLILSIILSKIYTINPYTQIIGDGGDNYEYFSFQNLVRENIQHGKFPLGWTNTLRYPVGFDLTTGYDGSLVVFSGGLLGLLIPLPLAYNLTIVFILFLNFYLSYLLFKKLSGSEFTGIFCAIIYGYSPYVFARMNSHLNLAFIGGFPLFIYSLLSFYERLKNADTITLRNYLLLFGSILLVAAGSLQYLIFLFYLIFILLIIALLNSNVRGFINTNFFLIFYKSKVKLLISLFLFVAVTFSLYGGYIAHFREIVKIPPGKYQGYEKCCIPNFNDIFVPNQYLTSFYTGLNTSSKSIEKVISIGIIEWMIFFCLVFAIRPKKIKIFLSAGFVLFILIVKNYFKLPYIPEGGRSVILFSLIFTIVLSAQKSFLNKFLITGLALLLILERLNFNLYVSPLPSPKESEIVQNLPGQAVLNIPLSIYNQYRSILPYFYQKKVIDGYFHYTAENKSTAAFIEQELIQRYICDGEKNVKDLQKYSDKDYQNTIDLLKRYDIRSIVLHKEEIDKFYFDDCKNVRYWWFNFNPETLVLSASTTGVQPKTLVLSFHPRLKAQIFFEKSGIVGLAGLSIFPRILTDTKIILPSGKIIYPNWEDKKTDIRSTFTPQFSFKVDAGNIVTIESDTDIREPIYLTIFYSYKADINSLEMKPAIEKIYDNNDTEIYQIN